VVVVVLFFALSFYLFIDCMNEAKCSCCLKEAKIVDQMNFRLRAFYWSHLTT